MGPAARGTRPAAGLPEELNGLRIAHLSDLHLGLPSRGEKAVERAVEWVVERQPDLTLIRATWCRGRVVSVSCWELLGRLPSCYAVLGNHDLAERATRSVGGRGR